MAIETTCAGCGKTLAVGDEFAGRQARCPACGQIYTVPLTPVAGPLTPAAGPLTQPAAGPPDLPDLSNTSDAFTGSSADRLGSTSAAAGSTGAAAQFWMITPEQAQYGPVDRANLNRWFSEGRVGPGYQIRQGEFGPWQSAEYFRPQANPTSANPYAATSSYPTGPASTLGGYLNADQSSTVLVLGILAWFVCPICGLVAWIMGHNGLKDMAAGRMDPSNRGIMQAGYYLGMAQIILSCVCCGGYFVVAALSIVGGGMGGM